MGPRPQEPLGAKILAILWGPGPKSLWYAGLQDPLPILLQIPTGFEKFMNRARWRGGRKGALSRGLHAPGAKIRIMIKELRENFCIYLWSNLRIFFCLIGEGFEGKALIRVGKDSKACVSVG